MIVIIGLGNPGEKYKNTRHNVGFIAINAFAKENNFPRFKLQKKSNALISEKDDVLLAKPQTFMNESGKAVRAITTPYTLDPTPLLVVIHDDIDLPLGKIKFAQKSGAGGHKGIDSIIQHLGNNDFIRLKIGIATDDRKAEEVVLQKFTKEEQKIIDETIKKVISALDLFVKEGLEKVMNKFN